MKKILSVALAAAMLGAMAIPAVSAADPAVQTTAATIDTTQDNTITINKFDPDKVVMDGRDVDVAASVAHEAGVQGATFTAFKVLAYDGTTKTYSFTNEFKDAGITLDNVIKASDTTYTTYGTTSELEKEISIMQKVAGTLSGDASAITNASGAATINLGKNPGVYLVMETVVPDNYIVTTQAFLVSVPTYDGATDTWVYNVDALPKNQKMDVDKSVDDATAGGGNTDAYAVGDVIDYTVTIDVPDYGRSTNYPDYRVTDAMAKYDTEEASGKVFGITRFNALNMTFTDTLGDALDFLPDTLVVKVSGEPSDVTLTKGDEKKVATAIASETATAVKDVTYTTAPAATAGNTVGDYTLAAAGHGFTLDIAWAALNNYQGQTITITYSAQLNENAVAGTAANNDITVSFVKDPTSKKQGTADDPANPPRDTDEDDDNDVYTYAMDLSKVFDNAADAAKAQDVVFTVTDSSNNPVLFTEDGDNTYTVWAGRTYQKDANTTVAVPAEYAAIVDADLASTLTSAQYNALKQLTANVSPKNNGQLNVNGLKDGTYTVTETKTADGYSILTAPLTVVVSEVVEDTKVTAKVSATVDGTSVADGTIGKGADGHFAFTVNNPKAKFFSLPTTGGLGLWLFTVGGGILMAGAIIFITVLRKKRA